MDSQSQLEFPPARRIISVSSLLADLTQVLERQFFDVWVEGEVSNLRPSAARHLYFTLKDAKGQIRAVMFAAHSRYLKFHLQDGMQVLVRGRVGLYEVRGDLQLYVEHVEPVGKGNLQIAFERLKEKLRAEGLFDAQRKRPLPVLPRCVGLITSPRGAAVADIIRILGRRCPDLNVLLYPVQVQGELAAAEICSALDYFAISADHAESRADVLVLARGGGSLEDLWPFNEESVARAIARSPIPTVSAIGHETDFTIADFVADLRAPTPSGAAEMVIRPKEEFLQEWSSTRHRIYQAVRYSILRHRHHAATLERHRSFAALRNRLTQALQGLDELAYRLRAAMVRSIHQLERQLSVAEARLRHQDSRSHIVSLRRHVAAKLELLQATWKADLAQRRGRSSSLATTLAERDPLAVLQRGYALVYDREGRLAIDPTEFNPGDALRIRLARGWIDAEAKPPSGVSSG